MSASCEFAEISGLCGRSVASATCSGGILSLSLGSRLHWARVCRKPVPEMRECSEGYVDQCWDNLPASRIAELKTAARQED